MNFKIHVKLTPLTPTIPLPTQTTETTLYKTELSL